MRCTILKMIDAMDARILRAQRVLDVMSLIVIAMGMILIGWLI